jgi:hypothetical protein
MRELLNLIMESFSDYFWVMFQVPSILILSERGGRGGRLALSAFILILAISLIFLCDRLVKKYALGFAAGVILTFFVLSLAVGLIGLLMSLMSISRLGSASGTFLTVCSGSAVINIVLSLIAAMGNRLKNKSPKAWAALLCGVGFLYAWSLATTFLALVDRLANS